MTQKLQMAQAFPQPNVYAEHHMETLESKIENAHRIIDRCLRFTNKPIHLRSSSTNFTEVGDYYEKFSCEITTFALDYYLHEVVTPGVPDFKSAHERSGFWRCVCSNKLLAIKMYLDKKKYYTDTKFLDALYVFVNAHNVQLRQMMNIEW